RRKLAERRVDLRTALAGERRRRFEAAPDVATLAARARDRAPDLWIRDRPAPDFLLLRVGLGSVPAAVTVEPETRGDEALRDELERELDGLATLDDVPQTIDVAGEHVVGLVGSGTDTTQLAASLVVQAACLHSPEDLVIVGAAHPDRAMASWMKWLPHARSASSPLALDHLACTTEEANRLLRALLAVAEQRAGERDRTIDRRWPRLLAVIDRRLEPEPGIVSRLLDLCPGAGISVLWLTAGPDRVPRQARSVVTCAPLLGTGPSTIASTDPATGDRRVEIDRVPVATADAVARYLAPIRDASSATGSTALPRTVTLHQALGTDTVDSDWVIGRWSEPRGHSLPTPIGLAVGGPLVLDLVAQGPHGLIGGTSGSGKSELLMSIVAGLAAVNPPTALNLLFVDYKGGASSGLVTDLPHTVGYVTNLDAHLARRALISLRAELNRRMDLLQGRAKDLAEMVERLPGEAPPSLVIVVDEFATLVKEVPDFIAGIVDIAQRGRSLGIHLLLATQRPSGSINENILANTNLRISLRVLDGTESSSVIGTTDAATIPTPLRGRAFARIGPGELVAFQSAWSGAPLLAAVGPPPVAVAPFTSADPRRTIARPATSGGQATATDGSRSHLGGTQVGTNETATTQVDGLLAAIDGAANQLGLGPGRSPWLEELPTELPLAAVRPATAGGHPGRWSVALGLVDDPERQAQYAARVDFEAGGGLAIFGTGGSGKTTALRTLAVSAALDDAEARAAADGPACPLTIVGLDYASRELSAVAALPQCAMIATGDDTESSTRLIAVLDDLLQRRRADVAAAARHGSDPPPFGRVLLLIDDYGNLAQSFEGAGAPAALYGWLETLNRVIVDGRQVGVHTALTASRRSVVKAGVLSAISNRIVLRQADPGGYAELGLPAGSLADLDPGPGRGVLHSGHTMQVAQVSAAPAAAGSAEAVRAVAARIDTRAEPELVTAPLPAELPLLSPSHRPLEVPIGIGDLSTEPVSLDLTVNDLTVVGDPRSGRSTALMTIGRQLTVTGREVWAVGPAGSPLAGLESLARAGFGRADVVAPVIEEVVELGDGAAPGEAPILLLDDADLLEDPLLEPPMAKLCSVGVRWVAAAVGLRGYSTNRLLQEMRKARSILYLQPPGPREVQEVTGCLPQIRPGLPMPPGRGVLVVNRHPTVVQLSRP
ncbi:MAG: FtsK/SpoIIIE domain-containing protein, partial [Acidimicrobiia bacterium]|nr:FtsK/SpoIIIE domain-containing protein [Acidimicrobiia bacterium]